MCRYTLLLLSFQRYPIPQCGTDNTELITSVFAPEDCISPPQSNTIIILQYIPQLVTFSTVIYRDHRSSHISLFIRGAYTLMSPLQTIINSPSAVLSQSRQSLQQKSLHSFVPSQSHIISITLCISDIYHSAVQRTMRHSHQSLSQRSLHSNVLFSHTL